MPAYIIVEVKITDTEKYKNTKNWRHLALPPMMENLLFVEEKLKI